MSYLHKIAQRMVKHAWMFWLTLFILPLIQLFWSNALTPAKNFPDIFSKSLLAVLFFPGRNLILTLSVLVLLLLLNLFTWILTRTREQTNEERCLAAKAPAPVTQQKTIDTFTLAVIWSPNGKYLASAGSEGVVEIWDGRTFSVEKQLMPEDEPVDWLRCLAWSPDSQLLAVGGEDGRSRVWNVVTGKVQNILSHPAGPIFALGWSAQGVLVATENGWSAAFSPKTGTWQQLLPGGSPLQMAAWSWQAGLLARISVDGAVDIQQGSVVKNLTTWNAEAQQVRALSWNVADTCLAIGYEDGNVQIWEVNSSTKLGEWRIDQQDLQVICWLPKGHFLISAGDSGILRIWQTSTGQLQQEIATSNGPVTALAISPDTQFLCSAHEKGTLALWEIPKRFR